MCSAGQPGNNTSIITPGYNRASATGIHTINPESIKALNIVEANYFHEYFRNLLSCPAFCNQFAKHGTHQHN